MTMTHREAQDVIATARNQNDGKPVANNTRLYRRGEGPGVAFGVVLHGTEVVTINGDGTYTLRAGGYHTVTTLERIRRFSPAKLFSERGEWFLRLAPSDSDPCPERVDREIPKPFSAPDPGNEPVKNDNGCQAGSMMGTDHVDEIVHLSFRKDMREDDELVEVTRESSIGNDGEYDSVNVKRTWTSWIFYGEDAHSYQNKEWNSELADKTDTTYAQCPHCKAFEADHERWRFGMFGARWGRRFDEPSGYAKYIEMMTRFFNDKDLWQQGYLEDLRGRRAYLKELREWDERNRIPFYDGIIVDNDGYALRKRGGGPSRVKLSKHEREVKRIKKKIDRYVGEFIDALKAGMPMPSGGDCWYCLFRTADGLAMGDIGDSDHLWQHIEDRYYVPSLAVNALRERGYKDVGIAMWLNMDIDAQTMGGRDDNYENVRRDLTKYMRKRMVPAAPTK